MSDFDWTGYLMFCAYICFVVGYTIFVGKQLTKRWK